MIVANAAASCGLIGLAAPASGNQDLIQCG
jgi:hypothetical protein